MEEIDMEEITAKVHSLLCNETISTREIVEIFYELVSKIELRFSDLDKQIESLDEAITELTDY